MVRVLLPLDGSEKDQRATQVADAFAGLVHGDIHIVRVMEASASIEQELRELAGKLSSGGRREVTWELIDGADVARELHRVEESADVIVMATRAPGTIARAFYGSVADDMVRKGSRPVIVVPPSARYGQGKRIEIHRVLVPLDGSPAALTAIERLRELATTENLEYVLVQAVHRENTGGYMMPEPVLPPTRRDVPSGGSHGLHIQAEHAEQRLQELAGQLRRRGDTATVRVVEYGDPASAIVAAIRAELVDLIAMSTHGTGGVHRLLHGSVANRVARESEVPVFLVTPPSSRDT